MLHVRLFFTITYFYSILKKSTCISFSLQLALVFQLCLWSHSIKAQPQVVKKFEPTTVNTFGSYPNLFVNVNGTLFFTSSDNINGYELWKTDGTPQGTK